MTDPFLIHEAMHTVHIVQAIVEDYLADHPAVANHPHCLALAREAQEKLCDLYQALGALPEDDQTDGNTPEIA